MSPQSEFAAFLAELSDADELALLEGASLADVFATAAKRDSERHLAAIWAEESDTAKTLRPVTASGFASDAIADSTRGESNT